MNKKLQNTKKGFTLVEVLVSVIIFMTAILPALTIANRGVILGRQVKDEFTASFLAQEAIEFIRYHIAYNANLGAEGTDQVTLSIAPGHNMQICNLATCNIDARPNILFVDAVDGFGADPYLTIDANGWYGLDAAGTPSHFTREVKIYYSNNSGPQDPTVVDGTEFEIKVVVTFGPPDNRRSITLKESIYDWRRP